MASWAMAFYGTPSTLPMFSSAILQTEVVESFFFHSRLYPSSAVDLVALLALLRPEVHTGASSQHSRPVARPMVLHVPALLSWRCRTDRRHPCSLTVGDFEVPVRVTSRSRLKPPSAVALVALSLRSCGRWFLIHWYYLQRSRPVVSPAVAP